MNKVIADTAEVHKEVISKLYLLDRDTQEHQLGISIFLLKHPELAGISYASAELLIAEKDRHVANAAINAIAVEIQRRSDVDAPGYRIKYARVTENQVRQILHAKRLKEDPNRKTQKLQNAEISLKCPKCNEEVSFKRITREKVVGFRTTETIDDAIDFISRECNVSRSFFVEKLLKLEKRFGSTILIP